MSNQNKQKVYSFYCDCHRSGSIDAIFTATKEEIDKAIGKTVHFGEILGKHSDVSVELDSSHFTELDDNLVVVDFVNKHGATGHNPLEYLENQEYFEDEE